MNCLICNSSIFIPKYKVLLECTKCGFVTAEVEKVDVSQVYTKDYFNTEYVDYIGEKRALQKNFREGLKSILRNVEASKIKSVLDIGCAYGFLGEVIREEMPGVSYTGLDVAEETTKVKGLNLYSKDYLDFRPHEKFTDIFLWNTISHLKYPDKFIEKIYQDLETGGRLHILTGDIEALLPRIQKGKWRLIHPPTHLHHFSKRTLSLFLSKYGFKVVNISYPITYRSINQIIYGLFNKRLNLPDIVCPFQTYDTMLVVAQKGGKL